MMSAFTFAHIWIRTKVVTTGYEVERQRSELERLQEINNALSVSKDEVMSVKNLLKLYASQKYSSLKPLTKEQLIKIELQEQNAKE